MTVQTDDLFILSRSGETFRVAFSQVLDALPRGPRGRVAADGTLLSGSGASVTRVEKGRYQVTYDAALTESAPPVLLSLELNAGNDDYSFMYSNADATGFSIDIGEQDNSGTAGVARDSGFSFFIPL